MGKSLNVSWQYRCFTLLLSELVDCLYSCLSFFADVPGKLIICLKFFLFDKSSLLFGIAIQRL